ncbi:MAG: alpha-isopropylmalate synthase regulatory domain-containing protein, partial [Bauldia litoralis]
PPDILGIDRSYEAVIRINSQSGKGGLAYVMDTDYDLKLPRMFQIEFSGVVQRITDDTGKELPSKEIWDIFDREYLTQDGPVVFKSYRTVPDTHASELRKLTAAVVVDGTEKEIHGRGNGPIDAFIHALRDEMDIDISIQNYHEHAVGQGADATAVAYVEVKGPDGSTLFGVGRDPNIGAASLRAIVSAANRIIRAERQPEAA